MSKSSREALGQMLIAVSREAFSGRSPELDRPPELGGRLRPTFLQESSLKREARASSESPTSSAGLNIEQAG